MATPTELANLSCELQHNNLNKYIISKRRKKKKRQKGTHIFVKLYEEYRTQFGTELVKKLELSTCPYCNRNFINSIGDKSPAQFDHFYNKSQYPIFALSFYNLIPCCSTCNQWKGIAQFNISPYDKRYTTDKLIKFSYFPIGFDSYDIRVNALDKQMDTNIVKLQLKERYATHIDLLRELISKRICYCKCNRDSLNKLIENNGLPNSMTIEEFFYGNYLTEDKYYLRPLSKFTHDILYELERLDTN